MGNTWKIVLATVVIFAAGVFSGGWLVNHANRTKLQRWNRPAATTASRANWQPDPRDIIQRDPREIRPSLDQQRMEFILRAQNELKLTPEQHERFEKIVREGQERAKVFWDKAAPEMRKNMQEVREQIRAVLTPEQLKKFEQIQKQRQNHPSDMPPGSGNQPGRGAVDSRRNVPRDGQRPDRGFTPPGGPLPPARDGVRPEPPPNPTPNEAPSESPANH